MPLSMQWPKWLVVVGACGWLLYARRLDLLLVVVPFSAVLGYVTARAQQAPE
jgi:hypothetical protein